MKGRLAYLTENVCSARPYLGQYVNVMMPDMRRILEFRGTLFLSFATSKLFGHMFFKQ
jgi:hypothetical protein